MEAAVDWLRAKGLAAAAKKAGRTAAEGLVGVAVEGTKGAVVEVNSETDFVAKNEQFQDFVRNVAKLALQDRRRRRGAEARGLSGRRHRRREADRQHRHDRREPVAAPRRGARSRARARSSATSTMPPRRAWARSACWSRSRARLRPRRSQTLGKQIAMHIAAANPLALDADGLDPALLERERAIAIEKANESGKPANIVEKMVEGAMAKFRKENALLSQLFVMDNKTPVADVVAPGRQGRRLADRAEGVRALPARRGHREGRERLRRRSRRGRRRQEGRAGRLKRGLIGNKEGRGFGSALFVSAELRRFGLAVVGQVGLAAEVGPNAGCFANNRPGRSARPRR